MLHAITLHRPWSDCIVRGGKDVEHRGWHPNAKLLGRLIAIHAGATFDDGVAHQVAHLWDGCPRVDADSPQGIVGLARFVAAIDDGYNGGARIRYCVPGFKVSSLLSSWWAGGRAIVLRDVVALRKPIPIRGARGLWPVPPDVEILARQTALWPGGAHDVADLLAGMQ